MTKDLKPDKPFKDIYEQIEILKNRGLVISDTNKAKEILFTLSYYDLTNGYKEVFMNDDVFEKGTTIEYIYQFSRFDRSIQNVLFEYSVIVETSFKTALAYTISKNYGVIENKYLDSKNFLRSNHSKTRQLLDSIKKIYQKPSRYVQEPTRHYKDTKNHIPPWILFKNITFDQAIKLYKILKSSDKLEVCNILMDIDTSDSNKKEILFTSINIIRRFRNRIAHNLKFITSVDSTYSINKGLVSKDSYLYLFENHSYNNVYSMIICLNILLKDNLMKEELNQTIINAPRIVSGLNNNLVKEYYLITGIPIDFRNRVFKLNKALKKNYPNNY